MEKILFIVFLASNINSQQPPLNPQPVPDRCTRPAEFMYRQCCVFPPFFTRDVARACGAMVELRSVDTKYNITAFRRSTRGFCEHWSCVLKRYGLLNDGDTLDDEKYYAHLDKWVDLNPLFSKVMINAKEHCRNTFRMFLPLKICEFYDIHGCIRNFINADCPSIFSTKECQEVKDFFDECREFYL